MDAIGLIGRTKNLLRPLSHGARERVAAWTIDVQRRDKPCVMVFPSDPELGSSADLRGRSIGRELRKRGWRSVTVPTQIGLEARRRLIARARPDVLFFQLLRSPLNDPTLYPGVPSVIDIDDAAMLDPALREDIMRRVTAARLLIAGNRFIAEQFAHTGVPSRVVWTCGYAHQDREPIPNRARHDIVAWGVSNSVSYAYERAYVADVAVRVARLYGPYTLRIFGVTDRGVLADLEHRCVQAGVHVELIPPLPYHHFLERLGDVAVGLAPSCLDYPYSLGKSFGKVLAYLSTECTVVAHPVLEHPLFFTDGVNGALIEDDRDKWAAATARLLSDPARRGRMADQAKADYLSRLSTQVGAQMIDEELRQLLPAR